MEARSTLLATCMELSRPDQAHASCLAQTAWADLRGTALERTRGEQEGRLPNIFFFFSECYITDASTNRRPRPAERETEGLWDQRDERTKGLRDYGEEERDEGVGNGEWRGWDDGGGTREGDGEGGEEGKRGEEERRGEGKEWKEGRRRGKGEGGRRGLKKKKKKGWKCKGGGDGG